MSDASFGLKIGLEGEREFKRSLTEINREFRVLGSEMKVVASQFGKNDRSASALSARNQVLAKSIEAQKAKIDTMRQALANATASFGEADSRTKNWQIKLNNATAELNNMERELGENTQAIDEFNEGTGKSGKAAKDASERVDHLGREVDELAGHLDSTGKRASVFGGVLKANLASAAIIGTVKALGRGLQAAGRGIGQIVKDGLSYNSQMENYLTSFTTMLGQQSKATSLVNELKKQAASTPFAMDDLAGSVKTMMSFGLSAKDALKHMRQLGDISQGDSEKLKSLSLAFAQISSAGKLSGQDLLQMINAGFNPLQVISQKTGKSMAELKDQMSKGAISAKDVADAMEIATAKGGMFYGAMEKQSHTLTGQLSTLKDNVASLKGSLVDSLSGMLTSSVLPMVNGWVNTLQDALAKDGIKGMITALGQVLKEAIGFITSQLPSIIVAGLSLVKALAAGIIDALPEITSAALQLVTGLVQGIIQLAPQLLTAAASVVATLASGIGAALPQLLPAAVGAIMVMIQGLASQLPMILDAALQLITGLAQGIIESLPVLVAALPGIIAALVVFLVGAIPQIIDAGISLLTSLIGALPEIIEAIVAALPLIVTGIVDGLMGAIPQLIDAGIKLFVALIDALPQIISTLLTAIPNIIGALLNALSANMPKLMFAGVKLFVALIERLPQIISHIVSAVPKIVSAIVSGFGNLVYRIVDVGANLVKGLWQGITNFGGWIKNKIKGWCQGLWDGITGFFGIHSPSKKMAWAGVMLTRGLAEGIKTSSQQAINAAQHLADQTLGTFNKLEPKVNLPIGFSPVMLKPQPVPVLAGTTTTQSSTNTDLREGVGRLVSVTVNVNPTDLAGLRMVEEFVARSRQWATIQGG